MPFIRVNRLFPSQVVNINVSHIGTYAMEDGHVAISFTNIYSYIKVEESLEEVDALITKAEKV